MNDLYNRMGEMNEDEMEKEGINAEVNVDESSGEVNIELKAN